MENEEKIVIKLTELPQRAEKLLSNEINNIFGGCADFGESCQKESDCCSQGSVPVTCFLNNHLHMVCMVTPSR